jgi:hypothetical protein
VAEASCSARTRASLAFVVEGVRPRDSRLATGAHPVARTCRSATCNLADSERVCARPNKPWSPLSRRLLWRRRDGSLLGPAWGGHVDRIHFPIQFYDVLFALQVIVELGRIDDPRCADALALLESKRLEDGGFPLEDRNARTADEVVSRGSFADWGPAGTRRSNPLVSLLALEVRRAPGRAPGPTAA